MKLPEKFQLQMQSLLEDEYQAFENSLESPSPTSIHLNTKKHMPNLTLEDTVPWAKDCFYLKERPKFIIDPYFHSGHYYVQEASSMFISAILQQLDIKAESRILDLCAAPGGKSLIALDFLNEEGLLHSHDSTSHRAEVLRQNITKWGMSNCIITTGNVQLLRNSGLQYDVILLDAPCSGEGMFRKEIDALSQWNESKINHCTNIQKELIQLASDLCAPGGYIIYSTCTFNKKENENTVDLLSSENFEQVPFLRATEFHLFQNSTNTSYRCLPHRVKGEGFTFSISKKKNGTHQPIKFKDVRFKTNIPHSSANLVKNLDYYTLTFKSTIYAIPIAQSFVINLLLESKIPVLYFGIALGVQKGIDFIPSHEISQNLNLNKDLPIVNVSYELSLEYLRANTLPKMVNSSEKWLLVKYNDAILGWVKNNAENFKNYYPKNQRIISY